MDSAKLSSNNKKNNSTVWVAAVWCSAGKHGNMHCHAWNAKVVTLAMVIWP